jgi:hypothetical protein
MESPSFRDILAEFLEEKTADSPLKAEPTKTFSADPAPLLHWQNPHPHKTGAYAKPAKTAAPQPPPPPVEIVVPLRCLMSEDRLRIVVLQNMGATELNDGISNERLKKAHRRLAKVCHPDRHHGSSAQFLLLQDAYEGLNHALKKLSASADGNESVSASKSPRQDAA